MEPDYQHASIVLTVTEFYSPRLNYNKQSISTAYTAYLPKVYIFYPDICSVSYDPTT